MNIKLLISSFVLSLKVELSLPDVFIDKTINEVNKLVEKISNQYIKIITQLCDKTDISNTHKSLFVNTVKGHSFKLTEEIKELDTNYKFKKYIKKMYQYISPIQYNFNLIGNVAHFSYIPLKNTLQMLFNNKSIFTLISEYSNKYNNNDYLTDYNNGSVWESLTKDKNEDNIIIINLQFYVDEFGISNPIGSNPTKITGVYFVIGNIPYAYRYNANIFVSTLCNYKYIKQSTNNFQAYSELFAPLLSELINLQTPFSLNINGREYNFRVILGHISGDNLSSHDIGGFQLNFSSGKI